MKPFSGAKCCAAFMFKQKLIYWLNWIVGLDVESSTDCRYGGRYVIEIFTLWSCRDGNLLSQDLSNMAYEAVTVRENPMSSNYMNRHEYQH